jgi:hypothetical protein
MCGLLACGLSRFTGNVKTKMHASNTIIMIDGEECKQLAWKERIMTESNLSWLNRNNNSLHKVIHNPVGPSVKVREIVKNAIGHGASDAYCSGCHGGETYHLMSYVDNLLVHVYTTNGDAAARDVLAEVVRDVKLLDLRVEEWVETDLGRRYHARFEVIG